MSSSHMKRLTMPRSWPLTRKTDIWVQKPNPGGHSDEMCMPLGIILRDVLGLAHSKREAKRMVSTRQVLVDGRIETDVGRGVGIMDVLTLGEENYRCVLDTNGRLRYRAISAEEAGWKVCRVEGKSTIKGGKTQVHLHDGRNILVDDASEHKTGDSLKISLPDQKVLEHIKFGEGTRCMLVGGVHVGKLADVTDVIVKRSSMPNEVEFDGFGTITDNVFSVGSCVLPGVEVSQ